MHLPGPLRAAVGLAATAASEAKHLPDRAIELPMLVISSALQASLRAQQRYARLAARGDEVLNRRTPTEEPPPWATFDEPVPLDELRRTVGGTGNAPAGRSMFEQLFAVEDPTLPVDGREPIDEIPAFDEPLIQPPPPPAPIPVPEPEPEPEAPLAPAEPASPDEKKTPAATKAPSQKAPTHETSAKTTPATKTPAKKAPAKKASAAQAPAKKAPAKKAPAKKAPAAKAPAKKTVPAKKAVPATKAAVHKTPAHTSASEKGPLSKPRHTAPSAFDNVVTDTDTVSTDTVSTDTVSTDTVSTDTVSTDGAR